MDKLTSEDIAHMIRAYQNGAAPAEIADDYNITVATFHGIRRRLGVPARHARNTVTEPGAVSGAREILGLDAEAKE